METKNRSALTTAELHNLCDAIDGLQTRAAEKSKHSNWRSMISETDPAALQPTGRKLKNTMKVYSDHYAFTCLSCNQLAFMSSSLYHINKGNTTAVADVGMYSRCKSFLMNSSVVPWSHGVFGPYPWEPAIITDDENNWTYRRLFACACCGRHWGALGERHGLIVPFMKLISYRVHAPDGRIKTYKKYCDLPLKFQRLNERAYREHIYDLHYKDCMDMKGTMTSAGGILRTEFAELYVPPGAVIAVKSRIQCYSVAFSSYLDEFMDPNEQVVSPSFGVLPLRVTDDNEIGTDKYCFMKRFVKHVCIKLTHIAHDPKNINVWVNVTRDGVEYRGIKRVDLSSEIIVDIQNLRDGVTEGFSKVLCETANKFKIHFISCLKPGEAPLVPHPNEVIERKPKQRAVGHLLNKTAVQYFENDAVAKFMYELTTIAEFENYIARLMKKRLQESLKTAAKSKDDCSTEEGNKHIKADVLEEGKGDGKGEGKGERKGESTSKGMDTDTDVRKSNRNDERKCKSKSDGINEETNKGTDKGADKKNNKETGKSADKEMSKRPDQKTSEGTGEGAGKVAEKSENEAKRDGKGKEKNKVLTEETKANTVQDTGGRSKDSGKNRQTVESNKNKVEDKVNESSDDDDSDDDDDDNDSNDDYFCADDKYVYIFTRHLAGCYTCTEAHRMTSTPTQITLLVYASIYQGYVDAVIYVFDPKEVHPQYLKSLDRYQHDHYRSLLVTHSITYTNNLDMDDMLEIDINNLSELQQNVHTIEVFNESIAQSETVSELFSIQQRRERPGSCIAFPQILGCYQFQAISQQVKSLKVDFRVTHKTTNENSKEPDAEKFIDMNAASYDDVPVNFDLSTGDTEGYDPFEDTEPHHSNEKPEIFKGFF